ncbi:hypothetical protein C2E23DRAFT_851370 [Lenzites betulinus]|nr:hypothetical protein C2E23DRAFT_851370 [Lenzites betulinus]
MDPETAPFNQCIFLNYYKVKRRLHLWRARFMEAGAGPHELPDDGDSDNSTQYAVLSGGRSSDSVSSNSSDFGEVPERGMPYDPVELLLDYILENSEASIAIACDTDLYVLFHDSEFPGDAALAAAIHERKPPIEVDERGEFPLPYATHSWESGRGPLTGHICAYCTHEQVRVNSPAQPIAADAAMWLLDSSLIALKWFDTPDDIGAPYAMLSHVWQSDSKQTFQDFGPHSPSPISTRGLESSRPASPVAELAHVSQRIRGCCTCALPDEYTFVWIDTCCINKTSSAELSEAINSMFDWLSKARIC